MYFSGIDDQETECDLDCIKEWDITITNNGSIDDLNPTIDSIVHTIKQALK